MKEIVGNPHHACNIFFLKSEKVLVDYYHVPNKQVYGQMWGFKSIENLPIQMLSRAALLKEVATKKSLSVKKLIGGNGGPLKALNDTKLILNS